MTRSASLLIILILSTSFVFAQSAQLKPKTDAEIKAILVGESVGAYKGSCACPYNTDKAGHSCGARSAYSRAGGASVLCYPRDVTKKMVDDYRKSHGG